MLSSENAATQHEGWTLAGLCRAPGCAAPVHSRGLCRPHYGHWWTTGEGPALPAWSDFTAADWFWRHVDQSAGADACWPWTRYRMANGYGRCRHGYTHRYALELSLGRKLRPGMEAAHSCDNRICCNPRHLREADRAENMRDAADRGRMHIGERNPHARLTLADIAAIRAAPASDRVLARIYGVSSRHVARIRAGTRWAKAA